MPRIIPCTSTGCALRPPRPRKPHCNMGVNRTILQCIKKPGARQHGWRCGVSSVHNPRRPSSALPKQQGIKSYGLHSTIPHCTPLHTVGRWSKTMVRHVCLSHGRTPRTLRGRVRESHPRNMPRSLLLCAVKKTAMGGRTWKRQRGKPSGHDWIAKKVQSHMRQTIILTDFVYPVG